MLETKRKQVRVSKMLHKLMAYKVDESHCIIPGRPIGIWHCHLPKSQCGQLCLSPQQQGSCGDPVVVNNLVLLWQKPLKTLNLLSFMYLYVHTQG